MATAGSLLTEDHFLCSICLGVFTDPATLPCGHNFCKECITCHWDNDDKSQCPLCQKVFNPRPELGVNTFLSELVASFRNPVQGKNTSEHQGAASGEVLCDFCSENKQKAVKSCQECLLSYCETHLELHQNISDGAEHKLINPVETHEDRTCEKHGRPLDKFCKTDQVCVCKVCETDHQRHDIVPLIDEYERKKKELEETDAYIQQLILERQTKIEQVKQSVKLSKFDTDREKANSIRVLDSLIKSAEAALAQLIEIIEESQKTAEKQAEGFIKELEEEIDELMKRSSEMKQLFHTKDHNQFLLNSSSLILAVPTKDWSDIRICSSLVGNINAAEAQLEVTLNNEIKKMFITVEAKRVQQYAVDVTLDPETASTDFTLSDDGKRVKCGNTQKIPNGPRRCYFGVLGKQGFSSGKFYFEVHVEGKNYWILGVAKESASRRYYNPNAIKGFWTLNLTEKNKYEAADSKMPINLSSKPQRVGVYVSYEEELVSFYDVDNAELIYSITDCDFDEEVYPYLNPGHTLDGQNCASLIICPVRTQKIK